MARGKPRFCCREKSGATETLISKRVDKNKDGRPLVALAIFINFIVGAIHESPVLAYGNRLFSGRCPRHPA